MNWLVTGGCGFIGTALIGQLLNESGGEHKIRVLDSYRTSDATNLRSGVGSEVNVIECQPNSVPEWSSDIVVVQGDITDRADSDSAISGADIIVHLAANTGVPQSIDDPDFDAVTNVIGTLNVLQAARSHQVGRVVFASSGAPLGVQEPPVHEEMPAKPMSPYGASKLAGEGYCSAFFHSFGVQSVVLRFSNVYGPGSGNKQSVVAKFLNKALLGQSVEIYGDGNQTRDFIFIKDLVNAICLAATVPGIGSEIFQIASNSETTISDLADRLSNALEEEGRERLSVSHGDVRTGDMYRNYSDTSKAKSILGWSPQVSLDDGLGKTVRSFLEMAR